MAADKYDILIAGAGIGGLTAALALLRSGHRVRLFDQASQLREIGAGVQIGPNGTRLLIGLGLLPVLAPTMCPAAGKEIRLFSTGQIWKLFDLGAEAEERYGAPYWLAHRGDVHAALLGAVEAASPGCITTSARVLGLDQDETGVTLHLDGGRDVRGDMLLGADGVHSAVRQTLWGDMIAEFAGRSTWRGLVPMANLPPHLRRNLGINWVGPGRNAITYPVHGGEYLNFVGSGHHPEWTAESWTELGTREECIADFDGWDEDVQTVVRQIDQPLKWAFRGRTPMTRWTEGRVTLCGDAAHPTLPALAQGACMALEDGIVLARCLDDSDDIETALQRYQTARIPRTTRIVNGSAENAARMNADTLGDPAKAIEFIEREWGPEAVAARYDWIFEYDARTAPV